jgi:hypothetical protein
MGNKGAGNYTEFESDGTMRFRGDATVWKDSNVAGAGLGRGATPPDFVNYNSTGIFLPSFDGSATTEQLFGTIELQHDYHEGEDIVPHIHWMPVNGNAGNVNWQMSYAVIEDGNETPIVAADINTIVAAPGVAWRSSRTDFAAISSANLAIGQQIAFRLFRDPTDSDTYASDAMLLTFGIHYPIDTVGSRSIITK